MTTESQAQAEQAVVAEPIEQAEQVAEQAEQAAVAEPAGPHALIIEDDDDLSTVFFESLKAAGFSPEVLQDGAAGLERLQTTTPYLVVLDLHLPHVNGIKILKSLRADPRLTDTRVVVVTADPRMADDARPFSDITLIKPVSFALMREMTSRFKAFAPPPTGA